MKEILDNIIQMRNENKTEDEIMQYISDQFDSIETPELYDFSQKCISKNVIAMDEAINLFSSGEKGAFVGLMFDLSFEDYSKLFDNSKPDFKDLTDWAYSQLKDPNNVTKDELHELLQKVFEKV